MFRKTSNLKKYSAMNIMNLLKHPTFAAEWSCRFKTSPKFLSSYFVQIIMVGDISFFSDDKFKAMDS